MLFCNFKIFCHLLVLKINEKLLVLVSFYFHLLCLLPLFSHHFLFFFPLLYVSFIFFKCFLGSIFFLPSSTIAIEKVQRVTGLELESVVCRVYIFVRHKRYRYVEKACVGSFISTVILPISMDLILILYLLLDL